ncbi:30S ribosomal protein S4 [Candidatus Parcubacteria bacterium]|nr:30S ribosomal protein S4 [Candidatus Parcubacteria bacterium]
MIIGPKYKICKRLGASVFEKCQTQKFQMAETRAPRRTKRGGSNFGAQLLEKQKARFTYGLTEAQFSRYVHEAMEKKGSDSAAGLLARLESRLDNVIYRLGLTKTRRAARQMVSHGHVMVNNRRMTIPSYKVTEGESISVREASRGSAMFANRAEAMLEQKTPAWAEAHADGLGAKVVAAPALGETESPFSAATIIQFYSR